MSILRGLKIAAVLMAFGLLAARAFAAAAVPPIDAPPATRPMSGFAKYEMSKWLLLPCAAKGNANLADTHTFIDASPDGAMFKAIQQLWRKSNDPARGVYVEFGGYLENQRYVVKHLQRALGWVESCARPPVNVHQRSLAWAAGTQPSWNFVMNREGASFQESGLKVLRAAVVNVQRGKEMEALDMMSAVGRVRVEFIERPCNDPISEAAYGYTVIAAAGGKLFTGCGLLR